MANTTLINHMRFSRPFKSSEGTTTVAVDVELDDELVDRHDYHDCPSTVEIYFDRKTLMVLHEHIGNTLYMMKAMEEDGAK
jgi:hypothetical protein